MARVSIYIISLIIITALFSLTGLLEGTPTSSIISLVTNPESIHTNVFIVAILGIVGVISLVGVTIGLISPGKIDIVILAPLVTFLLTMLMWDFIGLFSVVADYVGTAISLLIFIPITIAFAFDAISWWMGRT